MPIDQQRSRHLFLKLNRLLSRVPKNPTPEAVHQLRTTTRRIEALLETLAPGHRRQRKLARNLKRVRRRAGRIRDLDVHQLALRSLKIGRDSTRKQQLLTELTERRSRQERKLLKRLDADSVGDLRKRLRRAAQEILRPANGRRRSQTSDASNPDPRPKPVEEPLALALRKFARLARETGPLTDANLHQFRNRCKRIRYVAEMGGDHREVEQVVKEFKRLQDAVGTWHDWLTLTQTADELFASANDSALLNALQNITRAKFVEALRTASEAKRNLLAIRAPAPRPTRRPRRPKARVAARSPARRATKKTARKPKPAPAVESVEPQPQPEPEPEQPEAVRPKPSQPEPSEPEVSKASA